MTATGVTPTPNMNLEGLTPDDPAAREILRHCAYAIWESEGRPENRALDNWLQAETSLLRSH